MNRNAIEAIGLVLATLNFDDVYPAERELLREALEAAKKSQEQIAALTSMCETLNKLQETAVDMLKPAMETAALKEREACAKVCEQMEADSQGTECCKWPTPIDCAAAIRAREHTRAET